MAIERHCTVSPTVERRTNLEQNSKCNSKRPRTYTSPTSHPQDNSQRSDSQAQNQTTKYPEGGTRISFPPFVVTFVTEQKATIKEITDEFTTVWKQQHGFEVNITARFGHKHSLLIFTDDSSTFETLLKKTRWPHALKGVEINVKEPRQLPQEYSIVIQQFHRSWNEDEWLLEMQERYPSLHKITRMIVKDGVTLNAVRADFRSLEEVQKIAKLGKIYVGSMVHPTKSYHLPIRINKCLKCLRHDHSTRTCSQPRLCPRCALEHSMENGCPNNVRCANCGGEHISGYAACPIVQEKRRALLEQTKRNRAELITLTERQQHQTSQQTTEIPYQLKRSYAQVAQSWQSYDTHPINDIDQTLSTCLERMERRLEQFTSRLSSQLCEIEKKLDSSSARQLEVESVLNDVVIPIIQEIGQIIAQGMEKRTAREAASNLNEKMADMIQARRTRLAQQTQHKAAERGTTLSDNA